MIPVNDRITTSVDEVGSHVVSTARLDGSMNLGPRFPRFPTRQYGPCADKVGN